MDNLTREINLDKAVLLASQSLITPEELAALMERSKRERTEHWTAFERFVRVSLLKLRGIV